MLKAALIFFLALSNVVLAQNTIISTYGEPGQFLITVQKTPAGITFLRYEGKIVNATGVALAAAIQITPEAKYLELSSMGGLLTEITPPSAELQRTGLPVVVRAGEICASACAFMALASPEIHIEGLLAFHLPYLDEYAKEDTLYGISQGSVGMTLLMARKMFQEGWKLVLYYNIQQNSGLDNWIVFNNTEDLNQYRFTDPATFMDPPGEMHTFFVMNTQETLELLAAQIANTAP